MNKPIENDTIEDVIKELQNLSNKVKKLLEEAQQYNTEKPPITLLIRDKMNNKFEELQSRLVKFPLEDQLNYFKDSMTVEEIEENLNLLNPGYPDPDFMKSYQKYQDIVQKIKSEKPYENTQVKSQNTKQLHEVKNELMELKEAINRREYTVDKLSYVGYESELNSGEKHDPKQRYLPQIDEALQKITKLKRKDVEHLITDKAMSMQERAKLKVNQPSFSYQHNKSNDRKTP